MLAHRRTDRHSAITQTHTGRDGQTDDWAIDNDAQKNLFEVWTYGF